MNIIIYVQEPVASPKSPSLVVEPFTLNAIKYRNRLQSSKGQIISVQSSAGIPISAGQPEDRPLPTDLDLDEGWLPESSVS